MICNAVQCSAYRIVWAAELTRRVVRAVPCRRVPSAAVTLGGTGTGGSTVGQSSSHQLPADAIHCRSLPQLAQPQQAQAQAPGQESLLQVVLRLPPSVGARAHGSWTIKLT
jgi:hypothetical protein